MPCSRLKAALNPWPEYNVGAALGRLGRGTNHDTNIDSTWTLAASCRHARVRRAGRHFYFVRRHRRQREEG
jgi:hypothetical protein